jgi:hypothetical protein
VSPLDPSPPEFAMPAVARRRLSFVAPILLLSACSSLISNTRIEPGQAFKLGGGQGSAFTVRGTNDGPVPVVVYAELDGKRDSVLTLAPGEPVDATFPKSAMAIFRNTSWTRTATVSIKVTGDIASLGMRYEANPKPGAPTR